MNIKEIRNTTGLSQRRFFKDVQYTNKYIAKMGAGRKLANAVYYKIDCQPVTDR